jgi:hypothetical protein
MNMSEAVQELLDLHKAFLGLVLKIDAIAIR